MAGRKVLKRSVIAAVFLGLVLFLLTIILIIYFDPFKEALDKVFVQQEDLPPLSEVQYSSLWHDTADSENVQEVPQLQKIIDRYFECFYSALGDKNFDGEREMEGFFADSCLDSVYDLAALSSCAYRLKASNIDLTIESARIHIWTDSVIKINKDAYIFTLRQSAELMYKILRGTTGGEGIYEHTFILERVAGNWYITYHEGINGAWMYAKKTLNRICGTVYPSYMQLYEAYPEFLKLLGANAKSNAKLIRLKGYDTPYVPPDIEYNREAAVEYAFRWTSVLNEARNVEEWEDYENDSGNFISQCIYCGVKQMDIHGVYIWKWFGSGVNYEEENAGCSMSWTEGDNFWLYCTSNDWRGLCTYTDVAGGQLDKGDIVQLLEGDSVASQVIITDVVSDVYGNKVEFLVSGHDNDLTNYPLSLLHCDTIRFIKILGYNED